MAGYKSFFYATTFMSDINHFNITFIVCYWYYKYDMQSFKVPQILTFRVEALDF